MIFAVKQLVMCALTVQYCDHAKQVLHRSQCSVRQWHCFDTPLKKKKQKERSVWRSLRTNERESANSLKFLQVLFVKGTRLMICTIQACLCTFKKTVVARSQVKMWLSFEQTQGTVRPSHTAGDKAQAPPPSSPRTTVQQSSVTRNVRRNSTWQGSDRGLRDRTSIQPTIKLWRDGCKIPSLPPVLVQPCPVFLPPIPL